MVDSPKCFGVQIPHFPSKFETQFYSYIRSKTLPHSLLPLSLSISYWLPFSLSLLIIGWWIFNTGAQARGALCSIHKVMVTTVSSPSNYSSVEVSVLSVYPPPPSDMPHSLPYTFPTNTNPPVTTTAFPPLALASALPPDTGP